MSESDFSISLGPNVWYTIGAGPLDWLGDLHIFLLVFLYRSNVASELEVAIEQVKFGENIGLGLSLLHSTCLQFLNMSSLIRL